MEELRRVGRRASPKLLHQGKQCGGAAGPAHPCSQGDENAHGMVDTLKATGEPALLPATSLETLLWAVQGVFTQHAGSVEVCACPLHFVGSCFLWNVLWTLHRGVNSNKSDGDW